LRAARHSLRRDATLTAGVVLAIAALLAVVIAGFMYRTLRERSAQDTSAAIVRYFEDRLRGAKHEHEMQLMRDKTRLEFSRLLETPAGRWDRLRAYMASVSDSPLYAGMTLCDAGGRVLFRQGPEITCAEYRPMVAVAQVEDPRHYVGDAAGQLFLELDTAIWLGPDGMGTMHLTMPLDNAFLWRSAFPDTELFIEWQGRVIASSSGESALGLAAVGYSGSIERAGERYEQRRVAFPGRGDTPWLVMQTRIPSPFSVTESIWTAVIVFTVVSLLLGLALRGWLARLLPRIENLARGARLYAADGTSSAALDDLLNKVVDAGQDELADVARATRDMIHALALRERQRRSVEHQLRQSEQFFRDVAASAGEFVWEVDAARFFVHLSEPAAAVFGRPVEQLVGRNIYDFIPPSEHENVTRDSRTQALSSAPYRRFLIPILRPDGEWRWLAFSGMPIRDENGVATGSYRGTAEDVTNRRRTEEELVLAEKVFANSNQAILITDAKATILTVNPAFTEITGYAAEEAVGKNPAAFASGRHDAAFYAAMWNELKRSGAWAGEVWDRRKNGEVYPKWVSINAVCERGSGAVTHYVAIFSDITERKENEARIEHLAYHDPLTGLPNRFALQARLMQSLADARRNETRVALMFVDLDRFKTINDSLGHDVGDQLLIAVARRIGATLRESDTVARLGGDEFVIVVPGVDSPEAAARVAEKIIERVNEPLALAGHTLHTSPSIGIGMFPDDGSNAETLMKNADIAMYYAKQHGRNTYHFFAADMNTVASERLLLETQLRAALERQEFSLVYQPQLNLVTGALIGIEALARWNHPDRGLVLPEKFIPLAEETGLIVPLGAWVIETACRQAAAWSVAGMPPVRMSVNLSAHQLRDRSLVHHVADTLDRTGLPADRLELEITESAMATNSEQSIEVLRSLRDLGVRLAVDDFGAGFSSLAYLKRLPISRLKIDRSFVMDMEHSANDVAIAHGIVALANTMGLSVTAEGIETPAQLDILKSFGCGEGQGFLFSRPVAAAELAAFLQSPSASPTAAKAARRPRLH
jgi:diguanylate cyclase (GGDEF)-like protein/PAS domain S-box-containing protein